MAGQWSAPSTIGCRGILGSAATALGRLVQRTLGPAPGLRWLPPRSRPCRARTSVSGRPAVQAGWRRPRDDSPRTAARRGGAPCEVREEIIALCRLERSTVLDRSHAFEAFAPACREQK